MEMILESMSMYHLVDTAPEEVMDRGSVAQWLHEIGLSGYEEELAGLGVTGDLGVLALLDEGECSANVCLSYSPTQMFRLDDTDELSAIILVTGDSA